VLSRDSGVRDAEWIVAVDVAAGDRPGAESIIRLASSISPEWLTPTSEDVEHVMDDVGRVAAVRRRRYDALILDERPAAIDPEVASALVLEAWRAAPRSEAERRLAARLQCAGVVLSLEEMASRAAEGVSALQDLDVTHVLPHEAQVALQRFAPETLRVPSGRDLRLDYRDDGSVVVSVKLQEVFGLADSPTVGRVPVPVTFELLAPNQRPVQVTRDLRSFWSRGYPEVRRELRGRYPRHPWPEDPWDAPPTHRAKPRNSTRG
jgi:ATP-dependent helicase HrpB